MYQYLLYMIPAILLTLWASFKVRSTFKKYSKVPSKSGFTGFQAAREILDRNGLTHVKIEEVGGNMTDHYDPRTNVLRLSRKVARVPSLAAVGIAAHEVGHALQQAKKYSPLVLRQTLVPIARISSWGFNVLIIVGLISAMMFHFSGSSDLILIAIILLSVTVVFSLVTLPVEFNASKRARKLLVGYGIITRKEDKHVGKVLDAAAMTYVAGAASAIMILLYYLIGFNSND